MILTNSIVLEKYSMKTILTIFFTTVFAQQVSHAANCTAKLIPAGGGEPITKFNVDGNKACPRALDKCIAYAESQSLCDTTCVAHQHSPRTPVCSQPPTPPPEPPTPPPPPPQPKELPQLGPVPRHIERPDLHRPPPPVDEGWSKIQ